MFVAGSNYAELIRYLNGRGVKTTKGGEFNKNSFQRILSNRRYLGKYIYQGNEIDGGMPRIIDDDLFEQAQQKLALYAAAPARGKAKVEYILSENVVYANGHTKSKLELKRSNQCKSKSRDSLRNLDFLSTYIER